MPPVSSAPPELAQPPTPVRMPRPPARAAHRPWWRRRRVIVAGVVLLLVVLAVGAALALQPAPAAPPATDSSAAAPRLVARGVVRPLAQARVGTVSGGVLDQLSVAVGDRVQASAELGLVRPRTDAPVEVLTAPRAGTVLSVPVAVGDTLAPGAVVAIIADMSRLQVETTDLDEFLVPRIQPGQRVQLSVAALDNRALRGIVRTVAPRPETSSSGSGTTSDSYPVVVDITDAIPPDLRVGMGVRLVFEERPAP